jgi:ubiquinol-cytochrome c reductase cytochrome b subunit
MSTTQPTTTIGKAANFAETRVGASVLLREFGRKIFPSHWSFMLGEVALYSFIIVVLSGTFLTFFFQPAMGEMHYEGPWLPLRGVEISEAYNSTLAISLEIRGGLFIRQMHHWGALLFVAALSVHMLRVFFTGAFRRPRELNWVVGVLLVIMGMAAGFTGYSLPDDLLSGNGLRIIDGILKSLPLVGTYISFFLFGGEFPGVDIVARLYTLHIMIVPALLIALIGIHLVFVVVHKHTQYPGAGNTEKNVVGEPVLPTFAAKGGGFFFLIFGLLSLISALFTINPIWNYGPYDPSPVSAGTQPDWYIGWADGFLRIVPGWFEFYIFGWPISFNINSAVIVMGGVFAVMFIYPFFEAWLLKDKREHHILDRPRNNPTRTAIGVAGIIFYCNMWAAASGDIVASVLPDVAQRYDLHLPRALLPRTDSRGTSSPSACASHCSARTGRSLCTDGRRLTSSVCPTVSSSSAMRLCRRTSCGRSLRSNRRSTFRRSRTPRARSRRWRSCAHVCRGSSSKIVSHR